MPTSQPAAPSFPLNPVTQSFAPLAATVREMGLLRRSYGFYSGFGAALVLALGGVITGFVLLGDSWLQLLMAAALGVVLTQVAFLAHEASHRTVLGSGPANDRLGRVLSTVIVGVSHQWWMTKHTRHHGNPNTVGKDPDIEKDTISFLEDDARESRVLIRAITRRQGWLFFPLLTLEGLNLHYRSIASLITSGTRRQRWIELPSIALHFGLYLVPVFWFLPLGMAFAFVGVQMAVFGVYMGASFAPNHKGMAIIPAGTRVDFLSKQVLTSRNIRGGWAMSILMGGLNYQIEHHLFPSMARPHLARAREIVREHCATVGLPYTETSLLRSYGIVVAYLNRVGLAARDPFDCPERVALGR
ncbi:acyl-CoA desaturase [Demequina sp. SYSU T00039]|uniref:Acyl-CoA desaturase n=1 Tax=Demequina lignilytica TaxID=3051663 RepID=A0AAW7M9L5_9MICO|nr:MULTISPECIES: acyl-CoA desaturase [unclassified Demequina]MDN4478900.1 acyl-CoA desaturase [Demequina sp. SYSU T00039-1]MDN4488775.1 acyl-CoA desaturase [Demequina sp. SYSU T00039]MDN4491841.1 acyl-CoA desaturase [Demequina sp. SYSU T00068]